VRFLAGLPALELDSYTDSISQTERLLLKSYCCAGKCYVRNRKKMDEKESVLSYMSYTIKI